MPPSTISRWKPISNGIKNLSEGFSCWDMSRDVIRDFNALVTGELPCGSLIVSVFPHGRCGLEYQGDPAM